MTTIETLESDSFEVRELARRLAAEPVRERDSLLTMYIDLDPRNFATAPARKSTITSAIDEAERAVPSAVWTGVLEGIRAAFESAEYQIEGARGLLLMADADADTVQIVKLPHPVAQHVWFDRSVHIRPLLDSASERQWCVLLVNRRSARILLGGRDGLEEKASFHDEAGRQSDVGDEAESRNYRTTDVQVHEHLRTVSRSLLDLLRTDGFDRLLVAAPDELHAQLETELHSYVKPRLSGWLRLDIEHVGMQEIQTAVRIAIDDLDAEHVATLFAQLRQNIGRGERVAVGVDDVLQAIAEARVETVLIAEGCSPAGYTCTECDWHATTVGQGCPIHGASVEPCADVIDEGLAIATRLGAAVVPIHRSTGGAHVDGASNGSVTTDDSDAFIELTRHGGVAAILRFDLAGGASRNGAHG